MRGALWLFGLAPLVLAIPAAAQDRLALRSDDLIGLFNGESTLDAVFSSSFRKAVPDAQVRALIEALHRQLGRAMGIRTLTRINAHEANLVIGFEGGRAMGWIAVSTGPDARVTGLRITRIEPAAMARIATLSDVAAAFAAMPGKAGFIVQDLAEDQPQVALAPDVALGIGSAFKLVVLAELVRQIEAGERTWDDTITLDGRELPGGGFRGKPAGTQVSVRRLAEEMIRISDNSATDLLIDTLGRTNIEAMQAPLGFTHAARNVPFLKTMELFKLKGVQGGALGERYRAADLAGKRALLAGAVAGYSGAAIGPLFADGQPVMIDRLEWYASPADIVRALRWFGEREGSAVGKEALRILALNPGPAGDVSDALAYAGYKGGSEPGVLNMSVLFEDKAGHWKVVTASVNDPDHGVDEAVFRALIVRALELALYTKLP